MAVKVIAFGQIAEITGREFSAVATDTTALTAWLHGQFPALENKKYAIAVNRKIATGTVTFNENDEVALMPPYSGG